MTCGEGVPPGPVDGPGLRPWPLHEARLPPKQATAWLAAGIRTGATSTAVRTMPVQQFTFTRYEDDKAR